MSRPRIAGFRLGVYIFKDAEVVDFAAPYGVFTVVRRFDPELDAFLIADAVRPVQTQAGLTVVARVMEYLKAYDLYRADVEPASEAARLGV